MIIHILQIFILNSKMSDTYDEQFYFLKVKLK